MTKPNVPTLQKWAAKLAEQKRTALVLLIAALCLAVVHESLKRYLAAQPPCDQPCPSGLDCAPLSLSAEIKPRRIKAGTPYALWYRVELKNRSCRRLAMLPVSAFIDSQELLGNSRGLWISVTAPDGRELERMPKPQADGGVAWDYGSEKGRKISTGGTIHPYRADRTAYERARRSGKLESGEYLVLDPGDSFASIPSKLNPYRIVATSMSKDGAFADGISWIDAADAPSFPEPPEGFQSFDRYTFQRPGRYSLNFGYVAKPSFEIVHPHWDSLSESTRHLLRSFGLQPTSSPAVRTTRISLETPPQVVEVVP